jgi:flavin reductase (DIM6/NTAB) family NADH-FMN oxidoreductase RutF
VIDGVAAFVDCRLVSSYEEGDHLIFIGEVLAVGVEADLEPLIFHGGGYRLLTSD